VLCELLKEIVFMKKGIQEKSTLLVDGVDVVVIEERSRIAQTVL